VLKVIGWLHATNVGSKESYTVARLLIYVKERMKKVRSGHVTVVDCVVFDSSLDTDAFPVTKKDFTINALLSPQQLLEEPTFGPEARDLLSKNQQLFLRDGNGVVLLASQVCHQRVSSSCDAHGSSDCSME
jgi:hypothetical protein